MAMEPLTHLEKLVFGDHGARCSVTSRVFEDGIGSAPRDIQQARFIEEAGPDFKVPWKQGLEILEKAEAEGFRP
jgi:hypothetical protein